MINAAFFKPGPLGAFLGPTLAEHRPKPIKLKTNKQHTEKPWADGVMGEIVAEDRQEGVERF